MLSAGSRSPLDLARALPVGARVALVAATFGMWLIFMASMSAPSGQPERRDGRYYSNEKGELTEISYDEYRELRSLSQRRFSAVPAAFYAVGVAAAFTYRKLLEAPSDRPPPLPPIADGLPSPPAPVVDGWPPPPPPPPPAGPPLLPAQQTPLDDMPPLPAPDDQP